MVQVDQDNDSHRHIYQESFNDFIKMKIATTYTLKPGNFRTEKESAEVA